MEKQIKITMSCPFFTVDQTFDESEINKQIKWMQANKKSFLSKVGLYKANEKPVLKCNIEKLQINQTAPVIYKKPSTSQNLLPAIIEKKPVVSTEILPVKSDGFKIKIDGFIFQFIPKKNRFINLTEGGHWLHLDEVKELHKLQLLNIPKKDLPKIKYLLS